VDWSAFFIAAGETIKVLGAIATGGAAVTAAYVARRGLQKWRDEAIGKRRAELAEEVLADFYEARDLINSARVPGSMGGEGSSRHRSEHETEQQSKYFDSIFCVVERLGKKADFFAQLASRKYRFVAHFGQPASKPYDDLNMIYSEIIAAVRMLMITYGQDNSEARIARQEKWENAIGWGLGDVADTVPERLNQIVAAIENICRPVIQEVATKS
jgi:hypothetical protein